MPHAAEPQTLPMTTGDVAKVFKVHTSTVIDWADAGKLPCFRTPGGQRRFLREDVEAFLPVASTEDGAA